MENSYKVYANVDAQSRVIGLNSSAFLTNLTGWIQIDEGSGDRYHHAQSHYLSPPIRTDDGVLRYKAVPLEAGEEGLYPKVVERTAEEIAADAAKIPAPPPSDHELMMTLLGVE